MEETGKIALHDYWLEDDRQTVTTDQERAAFLLVRKGLEVPKAMLDRYPTIETADRPRSEPVESEYRRRRSAAAQAQNQRESLPN